MRPIRNFVLLAAGRGTRLSPFTDHVHKSLLPIAGQPALKLILDKLVGLQSSEVIIVTGHRHEDVEAFIDKHYSRRVKLVRNVQYAQDINILSTELGVEALQRPEDGYLIVETDVVLGPHAWERILNGAASSNSFWVTKDRYSQHLTGGALVDAPSGKVQNIVYAPKYDERFDGWKKLIGILYVAASETARDRSLRKEAIQRTIEQYYMTPWIENLDSLPCIAVDLGDIFAVSFNDSASYTRADRGFKTLLGA